ncbi:DNA-methyltransferase [Adhaeribacter soli]|uniref:Methyltransferase n=1 Tax=Adhaeribacter soli TaxID=2607655 RepID=A0A5N1IRP6_9BACT|nr:site-specific DNA-methyltransferase [Adhaeribacter soli]KAA9332680.1 site-specific DNA-methyltransferase [Adhaeribacter soli]
MIINKVFNEDAMVTMSKLPQQVDLVLTSPPYNTSRVNTKNLYNRRYSKFVDCMSDSNYIKWTIEIFKGYEKILKPNGVILYNLSYSAEKPSLMHQVVAAIIEKTDFMIADTIVWKKTGGVFPCVVSPNKLTRVTETIYVFCRKNELKTFKTNKRVTSLRETGQKNYANITNFIEAANNDGATDLNKATFSSDLVGKLIDIYAPDKFSVIYDSFIGTGTTARAAMKKDMCFIGSEIDPDQVAYFHTYLESIPKLERRNYKIRLLLHEFPE